MDRRVLVGLDAAVGSRIVDRSGSVQTFSISPYDLQVCHMIILHEYECLCVLKGREGEAGKGGREVVWGREGRREGACRTTE